MAQSSDLSKNVFVPSVEFSKNAHIPSIDSYQENYADSLSNPSEFWLKIAKDDFYWKEEPTKGLDFNYNVNNGPVRISWFEDGRTNLSYNCLDRHLEKNSERTCFLWEGNYENERRELTFGEVHEKVCRLANVLKDRGVFKGDRVSIYMPMLPELIVAVLACARIGAVHSVVFGGFSAESLADRILDSECKTLLTADGCFRGEKLIAMKEISNEAMRICSSKGFEVTTCISLQRLGEKYPHKQLETGDRDINWEAAASEASTECDCEWMGAEDPLFILYTSGSTGKPKGVLHTTGGYMVYAATTFKNVFDYKPEDIYWCTADVGWITGHSYITYGPMVNAATQVIFEGIPTYPDASRFWKMVGRYKVSIFYTAPTAIRALAAQGDQFVKGSSLESLRLLGTVGEPINPEAWNWYHEKIGHRKCPIVDTWWQTETGGILITPLPGATPLKPGSATLPFFGGRPVVLDPQSGREIEGECQGVLAFKQPWPGQMRTLYGDHERFESTYFSQYPGYYFTGDGCRRDEDGYYWVTGRVDDVLNVSGHRIGTAEVESALVAHENVAEAAVVGVPHEIKGQGIYAYVTLNKDVPVEKQNEELKAELKNKVKKELGSFSSPEFIHWAPALPKTRSGKIMRRILRKIAEGQADQIGDVTTLADPSVIEQLLANKD